MVKTVLFGRFAAFVLAFFLVQEGDGACLSTRGIGFKERSNAYLNATAFAVTEVQFSLHCLLACENDARCNSLNIIQTNKLICELHSGDSTTTEVSTSSTSSLYEIIPSSEKVGTAIERAVCEPECRFVSSCGAHPIGNCRCLKGSMLDLHWDPVMVGALKSKYASFNVSIPSGRYKLKLVTASGFLSCVGSRYLQYLTNFGCMTSDGMNEIMMIITDKNNTVLLPRDGGYSHDGRISKSVFVTFNDPIDLKYGEEIRIWYKEDLEDESEADNFGVGYMRVLALKID